jgi:hypothetical protein
MGGATSSAPLCSGIASFSLSATERFADAAGLVFDISGEVAESFEVVDSVSPESPHPKRHNGTANKQVPRNPNLIILLSEGITGIIKSSEDHLNELGYELVAF